MIVDGRKIAADIIRELQNEVTHLDVKPHMTVFTCAPNFETQKYLGIKTRKAKEVGIGINVIEFPENITTEEMITSVKHAFMQTDGVIVQLPLPTHVDTEAVLSCIPPSMDIDGVHYDGTNNGLIHPVAGAIAHIAEKNDVLLATQNVVVVGHGMLVGKPVAKWAQMQGAQVTIVTKETENTEEIIASADVLILGAGHPGLVKPDMIKEGVIVFDAGTSEEGGQLVGDAEPACAEKASLFTPVPGGIGPVTIAVLLRNVVELAHNSKA